jgi:CarD family transcriptional regulator
MLISAWRHRASRIRIAPNRSNFAAKAPSHFPYLPDSTGYILTVPAHFSTLPVWGATEAMDYKIGDKVVYPNHGVGVVEQISYGVLNGRTERYFMIRILSSGLRVMVPSSNAPAVGLRSVIRSNDASKVLGFLEKGKLNSHHDWKHRFKENSERMRTGSLLEVAVVLKSLVSLSRSKPLSFREKKMLERAKYLLVSEMATARNLSAENAEGLVVRSLAKAKLQFPTLQEPVD